LAVLPRTQSISKESIMRTSFTSRAIACLASGVITAAVLIGTAGTAQAASPRYTLQNVNSGKCLDVTYGGKDNFVPVIQYTCYGGPVQQWRLTYNSVLRTYTLQNVNSGKCLDVLFGGKENFVPVIQYNCYNGPIQQWKLTYNSTAGAYTLTNANSGKCLDDAFGGKENFNSVIQYTCYGGPNQQWRIKYVGA
jgi:hypothetical protein